MTVDEFDRLADGGVVEFRNPVGGHTVAGVVTRAGTDEVKVRWRDGQEMTILRHQVRIYRDVYAAFRVVTFTGSGTDG